MRSGTDRDDNVKPAGLLAHYMVTVDIAGCETHEVTGETYADLLEAVGFSPQEATVLVDDRPVPDDATVDADYVEVVQLVKGG